MKSELDARTASAVAAPWGDSGETTHDLRRRVLARPHGARVRVLRVTARFSASPKRVFAAWLDPELAGRWLFATAAHRMAHVEIDPRVAGAFRFIDRRPGTLIEYRGEYLEIIRDRRLVFSLLWERDDFATRVDVEIAPFRRGSFLTLTHENVPLHHAAFIEQRWTGILYGLGVTLDSPSHPFRTHRSEP
jgi:uncharacterized protein YndB with AHSA1/START domain